MSFAADYFSAYRALRTGVEESRFRDSIDLDSGMEYVLSRIRFNTLRPLNRLSAVFYAFKLVSEIRRQRVLVEVLCPKDRPEYLTLTPKPPVNLFPITINRTTVQMRPLDDNGKG